MNKTQIEWVKNPDGTQGYTWNPITGCLNGCEYCYARKLANGRLKSRYLANENLAGGYRLARGVLKENAIPPRLDPFYPRFWSDRCNRSDMGPGKTPKGIFVCDMSDLNGIGIPEDWTHRVLDRCRDMPQHRFYLLTKQPQNLPKWSPFPDNCWVGVTITNNNTCIGDLLRVEAKVKYLSIEPLLKWTNHPEQRKQLHFILERIGINWLIIGAQTNPYKPPKIECVQEIVEAADRAGIPVFLKDNLYPLIGLGNGKPSIFHKNDIGELRQEMPDG